MVATPPRLCFLPLHCLLNGRSCEAACTVCRRGRRVPHRRWPPKSRTTSCSWRSRGFPGAHCPRQARRPRRPRRPRPSRRRSLPRWRRPLRSPEMASTLPQRRRRLPLPRARPGRSRRRRRPPTMDWPRQAPPPSRPCPRHRRCPPHLHSVGHAGALACVRMLDTHHPRAHVLLEISQQIECFGLAGPSPRTRGAGRCPSRLRCG